MPDTDRFTSSLVSPEITRMRLAYMAVAMRDPNPVHIEEDCARQCGLPTVIAHGTFVLSYAAAAITRVVGVTSLCSLDVVLLAPVFPGEALTVTAESSDGEDRNGRATARISVAKDDGTVVGRGSAEWLVR